MMKRIMALLLLATAISSCAAQYKLVKAHAFFTSSMPGMAMQDDNGNIIDPAPIIDRFIYIECRFTGKPKVDSVFYNGILFTPSVAGKEETITKIGTRTANGKPVYFAPAKGNHLWRIDLQQMDGNIVKQEAVKKIIIKGQLAKIKFSYTLTAETELTTPDRY
jgi:hypothetical protein